MKFWFLLPNTAENVASYIYHVCWTCQRLWDESKRPEAGCWCLMNTVGGLYVLRKAQQGNPPYYDFDGWIPHDCGVKLEK